MSLGGIQTIICKGHGFMFSFNTTSSINFCMHSVPNLVTELTEYFTFSKQKYMDIIY